MVVVVGEGGCKVVVVVTEVEKGGCRVVMVPEFLRKVVMKMVVAM